MFNYPLISRVDTRRYIRVICDTCGNEYPNMFSDPYNTTNQGHKCAATMVVGNKAIYGAYGSYIADFTVIKLYKAPWWVNEGTICDNCIQTIIDFGYVKTTKETF